MASVASLGFSIMSRYSGHGVTQARRDLASLRAQMAAFNGDLDRMSGPLSKMPARWKAWGAAIVSVGPALVPLSAQILSTAGALTTLGTAAAGAGGIWAAALKGAIAQIGNTNTGLMGLEKNLAKQKAILAEMTPGTAHYEKQLKAVNKAQDMYNHALAEADPAQKRFVNAMLGMDTAWNKFISATRGQTLGVAAKAIDAVADGVGKLLPVVSAVTPVANQLAVAFQHWVDTKMDGWIKWLVANGVPALQNFITIGKNLSSVFGSMLKAFTGDANQLGNSLAVASAKLKGWADGGGFQRFLDYVHKNAPAVNGMLKALGQAIANVFRIFDGFSGASINILTDAFRALAALDPGGVKAFANSFLLLRSPLAWLVLNCPPLRDMIIKLLGAMDAKTVYALAGAFTACRIALMLMNAGLVSTPIGWIIIGIAAIGAAIYLLATKTTFFQTVWSGIWSFMKMVGAWFAGPFVGFFQAIGEWFAGPFVGFFKAIGAWFSGPFVGFFQAIGAWFTGPFLGFFQAVGAWFSGPFVGFFQAIWAGIQAGWNGFITGLATAWSAVSGALVAAWQAVWSGLQTAAQAVWTGLQIAWSAFTGALATAWSAVSGALVTAWNAVWNGLQVAAQAVWTGLQAAWSGFVSGLATAWSAVSGALSAAWSAVWSGLQTAAQAVWTALQAAWQFFLTAVQTAWTTVSAILTAAWNLFWNAIKTVASTIWTGLQTAWQLFLTAIQTAWTTMSVIFQAAWSLVWNTIKTVASGIWTALQTAWQTFTGAIGTIWDTASGALKKAWEDVWNGIKDTASSIWEKIGGVVEKGVNGVINLVNGIANGIEDIAEKVGLHLWGKNPVPQVHFANGGMVGGTPEFAAGGTVNFSRSGGALSGYAPGRDTIPAVLSRGEGVLTPEAVRGLGGAGFVHAANRKFAGHRGAGKEARHPLSAYGFADGGVALGGGVQAWHRSGPDPGWSFAVGGLPSEIPVPGGGTVGQTPGSDVNKPKGSVTDLLPDDLPDPGDLAKTVLGLNGLNSMVLGFMGKEAIEKLFDPLFSKLAGYSGPGGEISKIFVATAKKVVKGAMEWLIKKDEEAKKEYEAHSVAGAQSVSAWAALAKTAMVMGGLNPAQLPQFLALMAAESSGNPNAINTTDINAKNGIPSQGLMQIIPPNFVKYHVPGTSNNILDPLANMAAAANYILHVYGGRVPGSPYALGTPGATSGVHLVGENGPELVNFQGGETVTPAKETASILSGVGTPAAVATAAPMATAAPASAGASAAAGGMGTGASVSTPGDVQALMASLLASSEELQAAIDQMWQKVISSTNSGWSTVNGDSLTPMNAALAGTVPASLTAMGTAWTAGWTKASTDATTQWTAMSTAAFTPMNAMMTTEVPAAATAMSTGVTTATSAMQTGVQESWDATLQGTQTTWTGVQTAITDSVTAATTPINGLLGGFNNVSSALGMGISVPLIAFEAGGVATFSTGGMLAKNGGAVPGYSPGRDTFPAMLSPGEGVLTPEAVRGLGGPGFVYAANRKWSGHRGGGGSTSESLGKYMGQHAKCGHATGGMAGVMHNGVQHFASGTITAQDAAGLAEAGISTGSVTQGSFNSSVAASGSTHSGDGVVDISDLGAVEALRNAGWAAWLRTPEEGFSYHVHAVYMKATGVDPSAMGQEISFINGGSGLPAGSASTAETNRWGLNLGEWNFGPLIKEIVDGGITSVPQLLAPLVKKHLTKDQVAAGFAGLKAALDATNMGTGLFADELMKTGVTTHDGIVNNIASQVGAASFDQGGLLQPGYTLAFNGTGKPEPVGHDLEPKGSHGDTHVSIPITVNGPLDHAAVDRLETEFLPQILMQLKKQ